MEAPALFSKQSVSQLMDPGVVAPRASLERHHLFPTKYLRTIGVADRREANQTANFTVLEWGDNATIADRPPSEYVPILSSKFGAGELDRMFHWHALPPGWDVMAYPDFLRKRRELMARVIATAYERLAGSAPIEEASVDVVALVGADEGPATEFKSTLRTNLHTGEKDPRMELAVLKSIGAFLNSKGGSLIIGVTDDGTPLGLAKDGFENEDKMSLHLANLLRDRIGTQHALYVQPRFEDLDAERVMVVECAAAKAPVFVKDGSTERFYVRNGVATMELSPSQQTQFIKARFSGSL
jgi:hypothetical protein